MRGAKDPDEFLKQYGPDRFRDLLDGAENQIEYQLQALAGNLICTRTTKRWISSDRPPKPWPRWATLWSGRYTARGWRNRPAFLTMR